jgi:hypothetical protein
VVQILLNHNANAHALTSGVETALFLATYESHLDIVQQLSTYEGPIDKQSEGGITPMRTALLRGKLDVVKSCLTSVPTQIYQLKSME